MVLGSLVVAGLIVVWALLLPFALPYDEMVRQRLRSTAKGTHRPDPPGAFWQAGQWDSDPRHLYVANIGVEPAYQVSVSVCDEVIERTREVPPCRASAISSWSARPYYVILRADQWPKRQIQVNWRSKSDECFSQTLTAR